MPACHNFIPLLAGVFAVIGSAQAQSHIHTPDAPPEEEKSFWLHFSGQLRERATYLSAIEYDAESEDAGWFWTQRARITADAEAASWLRARASVVSALQEGGEITPIERNDLDLQEGFIEFGPENSYLRFGRQEIRLGSQRLVAVRDGTNVRRTWDGARARFKAGAWDLDAFALRLVDVDIGGVFNDGRNEGRELAGFYATGPAPLGEVDLYYLYAEFDARETIEGIAIERRHSLGARVFGDSGRWFWDWEAIYQFGEQGANDVSAWTIAANTGYRFEGARWSPEIMLSTNIASGDSDPGDGTLETFNALYPRGSYFSENALLGPGNFFNIHPYLRARPRDDLLVFIDANFFWRLETADGVYGPPGNLVRAPLGSDARFVDVSVSVGAEWEATENIFLSLLYTHSEPQRFIQETGPDNPVDFAEFTVAFSF
ncbi:MAG: alginate export family protein [Pseudomonadota bacterium]